jgi:PAS domain S-box-containing protein
MDIQPQSAQDNQPKSEPLGTERDYLLLVENVKDYAIVLIDPQKIKGYTADEIIGKHFSIFYTKEDIAQGKTEKELSIALKDGRYEDESWRVRKDGSRFWANVVITPLRDDRGVLRGFGKLTRDLTERRKSEELKAQNAATEAISRRAQEILEIATPVVQVWEGVIFAPLIGSLDSQRTQQLMEKLLESVVDTRSSVALIDITGVPSIDTQTARHLVEAVSAVRLLGADVILTGIRPAIAQTLVHLGVDLSGVTTRSSLSAGLRVALEIVGLRISEKLEK